MIHNGQFTYVAKEVYIYSPEHSIISAYKHLTFQFVLLELATHLIYWYAPLPSTQEYTWRLLF